MYHLQTGHGQGGHETRVLKALVTPIKISDVSNSVQILDSTWAMWWKICIGTGEVQKYKVRLNSHGGQQIHGVSYWETSALVVMWTTIHLLLLTLLLIPSWKSRLDFVLAYPQADVEGTIFMQFPNRFELDGGKTRQMHVLQLIPKTKHINKNYSHFVENFKQGRISVHLVRSEN